MKSRTEQEVFWSEQYAEDYIEKNQEFDFEKGNKAWEIMLNKATGVSSVLECGCNIGRNIGFLGEVLPESEKSIIEIPIKDNFDFFNKNIKKVMRPLAKESVSL